MSVIINIILREEDSERERSNKKNEEVDKDANHE